MGKPWACDYRGFCGDSTRRVGVSVDLAALFRSEFGCCALHERGHINVYSPLLVIDPCCSSQNNFQVYLSQVMHRDWIIFCGAGMCSVCAVCIALSQRELRNLNCCFGARQQHLTFFVLNTNYAIETPIELLGRLGGHCAYSML